VGATVWGYEAAGSNARLLQYDLGTHTFETSCVPPGSINGRGIAYDPVDGNLWYAFVDSEFHGDGFIHKTTPPPTCAALPAIRFGDGPGGAIQDDVGALDIDPDDGQIWAAGYLPVGGQSFVYKLDRVTGAVLQSCWVPFGGGGAGNDSLAVARLSGLPGSGKYLLTDAGELTTAPDTLLAVDALSCIGGVQGAVVGSFNKTVDMAGITYRGGSLIATSEATIYELGPAPFATIQNSMSASPSSTLEGITRR
jgi:hypothetical protein